MKKYKLVGIAILVFLFSSVPSVVCQPHTGEAGGVDLGVVANSSGSSNPSLLVLVAYDEEIAGNNYEWFDDTVSGRTYVEYQTRRALYRFPSTFHLEIADYVQWNSEDDATLEESLLEVERELGWNKDLWYDGKWMRLLVAWTGQNNDCYAGKAYVGHACCINTIQTDWTDDNTVQEEVTHLFGIDTHCEDDGCVMSVLQKFYGWISENLRPIENRTVNWIAIWNWQSVGCVSHGWCESHYSQLLDSHGNPDIGGSEMLSYPRINPVNPPPEGKKKISPANPWVPWLILTVALTISAIVAVYVYKRKRRAPRIQNRKQLV